MSHQNPNSMAPTHDHAGPATPPKLNVGLLVWAAVLVIIGLVLIIVPIMSFPSFKAVIVGLFLIAGFLFLGLAYYLSKNDSSKVPNSSPTD